MLSKRVAATLTIVVPLAMSAQPAAEWKDPSPHRAQLVTVQDDVKLEVLDWGGSGRRVVLLSGLGIAGLP